MLCLAGSRSWSRLATAAASMPSQRAQGWAQTLRRYHPVRRSAQQRKLAWLNRDFAKVE